MTRAEQEEAAAMADAASPRTGHALAAVLAHGDVVVPGLYLDGGRPSVRLVGTGESYAAWLVEAGAAAVLFRFPRRPPEEMPAAMADEFRALRSVPDGVGTRGIAMDDTPDDPLGRRYLVTTFVPGDVVDGVAWTREMLADLDANLRYREAMLRCRTGGPNWC